MDDSLRANQILEEYEEDNWPPKATLARRAQSYTDFYHVARAQLHKNPPTRPARRQSLQQEQLDEHDQSLVDDLYDVSTAELLYASHDKYQYAQQTAPPLQTAY